MELRDLLKRFTIQARDGDLKTASYPKELKGYKLKISFGMGSPARIPWIALTTPENTVSNGYYPVYLFYKELNTLILSYGVSETNEYIEPWTPNIISSHQTIESYFEQDIPRYGGSYVFKSYSVDESGQLSDEAGGLVSDWQLNQDLDKVLDDYQKATNYQVAGRQSASGNRAFYLEKQLEDFIIANWSNTKLGDELDLIIEDGEIISQQYRTETGPIDILVKDKKTGSYVVIELKKGQTSDHTIGQVARYMGWVEEKLNDKNVRGIIIAGGFDRKLELALKRVPGVEVYTYKVDFNLEEFRSS